MDVKKMTVIELKEKLQHEIKPLIVDIRTLPIYNEGHIDGAQHLSEELSQKFLDETAKETAIVVCCYRGNSSVMVANWLIQQGYTDVSNLEGGYEAWLEA